MILSIQKWPSPVLKMSCSQAVNFDDDLRSFIDDMKETMLHFGGIGLAANQVGYYGRIIVVKLPDGIRTLINPEILFKHGDKIKMREGCLSVPGYFDEVERFRHIIVNAQDEYGDEFEFDTEIEYPDDPYASVVIQHEIDHLNGVVFVDYLSELRQNRARKAVKKYTRGK